MRQAPNQKRPRGGRSAGRRSGGPGGNRTYESSGPGSKIRGNASQLFDKYQAMARDAQLSGDRVAAENYMQHAEHYFRLLNQSSAPQQQQPQQQQRGQGQNAQGGAQGGQSAPESQGGQEDSINSSRSAPADIRGEKQPDTRGEKQPDIEPIETDDGEPTTAS